MLGALFVGKSADDVAQHEEPLVYVDSFLQLLAFGASLFDSFGPC